jgi:hypothetical protein
MPHITKIQNPMREIALNHTIVLMGVVKTDACRAILRNGRNPNNARIASMERKPE